MFFKTGEGDEELDEDEEDGITSGAGDEYLFFSIELGLALSFSAFET
jgi:hypothetical protein